MRVRSKYYDERPAEVPCEWCREIVSVKPVGRVPRFCSDNHRRANWRHGS